MLCVLRCASRYVSGISIDREGFSVSVSDDVACAMIGECEGMNALLGVLSSIFEELALYVDEVEEV